MWGVCRVRSNTVKNAVIDIFWVAQCRQSWQINRWMPWLLPKNILFTLLVVSDRELWQNLSDPIKVFVRVMIERFHVDSMCFFFVLFSKIHSQKEISLLVNAYNFIWGELMQPFQGTFPSTIKVYIIFRTILRINNFRMNAFYKFRYQIWINLWNILF